MRSLPALFLTALLLAGISPAAEDDRKEDPIIHVEARKARALLTGDQDEEKPVILDIRTPAEFSGGHLEGARNINFIDKNFAENLAKLDREKPYVVY